jgi:DNA-binding PadR family transcriptional regulator
MQSPFLLPLTKDILYGIFYSEYTRKNIFIRRMLMAPRKRSNLLALVVLSLLTERPMHPYEMAAVMRQRGLSSTVKLNFGALYSTIETLRQLALIVPVKTQREGRHPERTIYATTEAGRAELFDWLQALLRTPVTEYTQFVAGLALIAHLSPLEAMTLLEDRMHALSEQIDEQHAALETGSQQGVDRLFLIEDEYRLAQQISERGWVEKLLEEIKNGTLTERSDDILRWKITRPDLALLPSEDGGEQE